MVAIFVSLAFCAVEDPAVPPQADRQSLQGQWQQFKRDEQGPFSSIIETRWDDEGNRVKITNSVTTRTKIEQTKDDGPDGFTHTGFRGAIRGIYKLDGDRLILCEAAISDLAPPANWDQARGENYNTTR